MSPLLKKLDAVCLLNSAAYGHKYGTRVKACAVAAMERGGGGYVFWTEFRMRVQEFRDATNNDIAKILLEGIEGTLGLEPAGVAS